MGVPSFEGLNILIYAGLIALALCAMFFPPGVLAGALYIVAIHHPFNWLAWSLWIALGWAALCIAMFLWTLRI
jgi:hypothetical protein